MLGGSIQYIPDNHAYRLTISSIKGLSQVVFLINGLLRTPKIYKFHTLVTWLNNHKKESYPIIPVDTSPVLKNAWGFFDADGSFYVRVTSKNKDGSGKDRVEIRISLEQRMTDPDTGVSYFSILESIASALNVNLNISHHNAAEYYCVSSTSPLKLGIFVNYITNYPLFTSKHINYLDWQKVYTMIINNEHITHDGRNKIQVLKNSMNKSRVYFD